MKELSELLYGVSVRELTGNPKLPVGSVAFDSRKVEQGSLFVAVRGATADGHDFIAQAAEAGAAAVLCEDIPKDLPGSVTVARAPDTAKALGQVAANYYDNPARELIVVGVTGTNGKTSVASFLFQLFRKAGYRCGLLSTIHVKIEDESLPATHTTPDPLRLHEYFARMRDESCDYCFMEVSSHACHQQRIAGIPFKCAIFTNITHDHLDYHKTFANYLASKKSFFDGLSADAVALTNEDDKNSRVMTQNTKARVKTYALRTPADYQAKMLENDLDGMRLLLDGEDVWLRVSGGFNAWNLLAVYAAARELGLSKEDALLYLSALEPAPGRMETLRLANGATVVIDYAHTPDALKNVLETIADANVADGRVIAVVGCGGNRDPEKRPLMARAARELAHEVILTSDNPRFEDPQTIINEMLSGIGPGVRDELTCEPDRRAAIRLALARARRGDVALIAGKGHETYQEINGERFPFDDKEEALNAFNELNR